MKKPENLQNKKFNRLLAIGIDRKVFPFKWICLCECGKYTKVRPCKLKSGTTKSCGCYKSDGKHKQTGSDEYRNWQAMKARCYDKNHKAFKWYGGRGIKICDRWKNSFENFFEDMGNRPSKKHTVDRINNNKGYSKENCRWATISEQAINKRNTIFLEYKGEIKSLRDWAKLLGIAPHSLKYRVQTYKNKDDVFSIKKYIRHTKK